jgi:hypothetical protein
VYKPHFQSDSPGKAIFLGICYFHLLHIVEIKIAAIMVEKRFAVLARGGDVDSPGFSPAPIPAVPV